MNISAYRVNELSISKVFEVGSKKALIHMGGFKFFAVFKTRQIWYEAFFRLSSFSFVFARFYIFIL
ncbi:hypothetical protein D3C72_2110970 [compost metagenome]